MVFVGGPVQCLMFLSMVGFMAPKKKTKDEPKSGAKPKAKTEAKRQAENIPASLPKP